MHAYILESYGSPEGARPVDVRRLCPATRHSRRRAAGLNPVYFKFRQGKLRAVKQPKSPFVLGNELAGEVVVEMR